MNSDVLLCCTGRHASNKRLITFGDNYEKGRAMPYIPDGQVLAVPSRAYPPSSGCSWWKWRKPARSALKVEAVRTFGWLAPGHKFPVGQVDSKNVLLLERAVQNSRVWVMRGFHCCNFGSECPCPVLYVINERELLLGHASIVVIDEEGLPWVAPSLVLHYVIEHEYDPGRKFYDAPETLVRFLQNRIPAPLLDSSQRSW